MPPFEYKGKDRSGEGITGTIEADSYSSAQTHLKNQGISVQTLKPARVSEPAEELREVHFGRIRPSRLVPILTTAFLLVAALGWIGYRYWSRPWGVRLRAGDRQRVLHLQGQITFDEPPAVPDPYAETYVTLLVPAVPAEFRLNRGDLGCNALGCFDVKLPYLSPIEPHMVNLVITQIGYRRFVLSDIRLPKVGETLKLPPIQLIRAGRKPPPPVIVPKSE